MNADALRLRILENDLGTPEKQKEDLVDFILSVFEEPDHWPMDDGSRICVLKALYRKAINVKRTQGLR